MLRACGDDDALRDRVRSVLKAHASAKQLGALSRTRVASAVGVALGASDSSAQSWVGRRLGAYEITSQIAQGGMGAVFKAIRADAAFTKEVAVKLVRDGVSGQQSATIAARFRAERQILASLEHPNIARLIDGGSSVDGHPYLVMEYVDGQPINVYARTHNLSIAQKLTLFQSVCSAVQFAHQHLVVHRDLKPSNILVTESGEVKLLDFGIAKLLDPPSSEPANALPTVIAMTPAYASPEQVKGETITTASDVYALGVILYELLTGHSPYKANATQPLELAKEICEQDPARPSTVVSHSTHATNETASPPPVDETTFKRLKKGLRGDLDNIVLMALRKEPARRYASVQQLAEDVRRHTESLPVSARADTFSYRASKFASRNRWAVGFSVIAFAGMAGAFGFASHQAHEARLAQARAERHFSDVRTLVNGFMFKFFEQLQEIPGTRDVQRQMVDTGAEYLSALAKDSASDPALSLEAARGFINLAKVQSRDLVDAKAQASLLKRALGLIEQAARHGAEPSLRIRLELSARTELSSAQVNTGDVAAATVQRATAVALARSTTSHPDQVPLQLARADALMEAARLGAVTVPAAERWALAQEALTIQRAVASRELDAEARSEVDHKLAIAMLYAATVASENAPQDIAKSTARELGDAAVRMFESQNSARPGRVSSLANLAFATSMTAEMAREAGDLDAARRGFRRAREYAQNVARAEPNLPQAKLNSVGAAMAEIELELSAKTDPAKIFLLVQAASAEAATLPASLAAERSGMAVTAGLGALASEVKVRWCAAVNAPPATECSKLLREAVEGFRETNRLLPQIEDMIQRDNGEMLQLIKTGVERAEAALAMNQRQVASSHTTRR